MLRPQFKTFIGVDLGGGKGKNTAVARLELVDGGVEVRDYGTGKEAPWYDDRLLAYLREHREAVIAVDAPLTLPSCVRCELPACPGTDVCTVPAIGWFRERENGARVVGKKPKYTPYTQRASEVLLHEEHKILPRETLGQGMGPLTARAAYLTRALSTTHRLNENLIEVYPKATLTQLFAARTAGRYKRSGDSPQTRLEISERARRSTVRPRGVAAARARQRPQVRRRHLRLYRLSVEPRRLPGADRRGGARRRLESTSRPSRSHSSPWDLSRSRQRRGRRPGWP